MLEELLRQETFMLEMKIFRERQMRQERRAVFGQYIQTRRYNFITKLTQADALTTLALDNKIVQMILNGLPKSYQTFIQRGQPHPTTLEALFAAVEIEERTQESAGHS